MRAITHTHVDPARIHSHTYINTVTTTSVRSASSAITEYGIELYLKVPEGGRANRQEYPEKTPDSLPANRYHIIIRGENPNCRTGIEPSSSKIVDKLAWPRALAASDPLSYRPPMTSGLRRSDDESLTDVLVDSDSLVCWLTCPCVRGFVGWFSDILWNCLMCGLTAYRNPKFDRKTNCLTGGLVGRSADWLTGCLVN